MADAEALYDDITAAPAEEAAPAAASEELFFGGAAPAKRTISAGAAAAPSAAADGAAEAEGHGVLVGNMAWWTTDAQLAALCAEHGKLVGPPQFFEEAPGTQPGMAPAAKATSAEGQTAEEDRARGAHARQIALTR